MSQGTDGARLCAVVSRPHVCYGCPAYILFSSFLLVAHSALYPFKARRREDNAFLLRISLVWTEGNDLPPRTFWEASEVL